MSGTMKGTLRDRLGVIFDPRFWCRRGPVDHEWSDMLEQALDRVESGEITAEWRKARVLLAGLPVYLPVCPLGNRHGYQPSYGRAIDPRSERVVIPDAFVTSLPYLSGPPRRALALRLRALHRRWATEQAAAAAHRDHDRARALLRDDSETSAAGRQSVGAA